MGNTLDPTDQEKTLQFDDEQKNGEPEKTLQFDDQSTDPSGSDEEEKTLVFDDEEEEPDFGPADADVSQAGEPDESIGRLVHGISQFGESTASFFAENLPKTAAFIAENTALGGSPEPPTPEEVEDQSFSEWLFGDEKDVEELQQSELWQFGETAGRELDQLFPENPEFKDEFLANALPNAAGQLLGLAGTTALTGGSNLAAGAALGASTQAPAAFKSAKRQGASDEEAMKQFYANLAIGGLEAIPVARSFRRIDQATGGLLKKTLGRTASNTLSGVAEEATQEAVSTFLNNVSSKAIFDESRNLLENVPESAALGGILGGALNGVGTAVNSKLARADSKEEVAEVIETRELLRDKVKKAVNRGAIEKADAQELLNRYTEPAIKSRKQPSAEQVEDVSFNQKTLSTDKNESEESFLKKTGKWFKDKLVEDPNTPVKAVELRNKWKGRIEKEFRKAKRNIDQLERSIQEEYAGGEVDGFFGSNAEDSVPDQIYEDVGRVLRGEANEGILPDRLREPVKDMRVHVDRLSRELINKGIAEGDLQVKIKRNLGTYLTRAYRKDSNNIDWTLEDVPEHIKTSAAAHFKKMYRRQKGEEPSKEEVRIMMEESLKLQKDDDATFAGQTSSVGIDWGPFKKRQDIPEPVRALWGEFTDGAIAYGKTVEKVANLVHTTQYQRKIRRIGLKEGWLQDPTTADLSDLQGKVEIAPENSRVKKPLAGLRADKEVKDAILDIQENYERPAWMELAVRANGGMKFMATVGNQITHVRNFFGGSLMQMNQGVNPFDPERNQKVYRTLKKDMGLRGPVEKFAKGERFEIPEEVEARIDRLRELGLMDESVRAGDLMGLMADAEGLGTSRNFADRIAYRKNKDKNFLHSAQRATRRTGEAISQLYQAEDNFHRISLWMAEADRFSKAFHDKPFSELQGEQKRRIEQYAANLAKRNYQNYSQVPEFVRNLRRQPLLGTFVSFPYEVARTTVNTTRTAAREITHSNKEVRKIGWKRLASQAAMTSGIAASTSAAGFSALFGASVAQDELEDYMEFVAPWDKGGALGVVNKDGTEIEYLNFSYLDPYGMIGDPLREWASHDNPLSTDAIAEAGERMARSFEPFYSPDLLSQKLLELRNNENQWGGRIYPEAGSLGRVAGDMAAHFFEAFKPQIVQSAQDIVQANGMKIIGGGEKEMEADNAWLSAAGFRVTKVDTEKSFEIEASRFADKIRQSRQLLNEVKFEEGSSFSERLEAMRNANNSYAGEAAKFERKINAIRRIGLTRREVKSKLVDAGVSKEISEKLIRGRTDRAFNVEDVRKEEEKLDF